MTGGKGTKCQGLSDGPCPQQKRDSTVRLCQGDLLLCHSCEEIRFPSRNSDRDSRSKPDMTPVIQPVLMYIAMSMMTSTCESIKKAVLGFFTLPQIVEAKNCLWSLGDTEVLGSKTSRRDSNIRSEAEAHVVDILNGLYKLDKADKMPLFSIDYISMSKNCIPLSKPMELNDIMVCERLNSLEGKFKMMQNNFDTLILENQKIRQSIDKHPSYASILANSTMETIPKRSNEGPKVHNSPAGVSSTNEGIEKCSNVSDKNTDFVVPSYHKKKSARVKPVIGKSQKNELLKGAPEPSRDLFIFRTDKSTTEESLKEFVRSIGYEVRNIVVLSHKDSVFKSFKLTVPLSQVNEILNPDLWPEGVGIRHFRKHREKKND
jgi:hypothetical protein